MLCASATFSCRELIVPQDAHKAYVVEHGSVSIFVDNVEVAKKNQGSLFGYKCLFAAAVRRGERALAVTEVDCLSFERKVQDKQSFFFTIYSLKCVV
jgi:signal-transduction protein with cAMP-binding, CBS, and nucleotidyltransferase domain